MANSVSEAVAEAIADIESNSWVVKAVEDVTVNESKPGNYVRKRLDVLHKVQNEDYTYSGKEFYVSLDDFTWVWHSGANGPAQTPVKDFFESKLETVKTNMSLDHLEITSVDEDQESCMLYAVKGTTGNNADTYIVKAWKTGETTADYKIISKTTIS